MKKLILLFVITSLSNALIGQESRIKRLDSLFTAEYSRQAFNGNVLIAEEGEIIFEKSYGLANEESKQKLNAQTIFELASVSKQFTAMGIVLLQKQGKLSYEGKISKYLPKLDFYGNITIRNLLNHTGGLPDYMGLMEENWDKTKFVTNQDIVNEFAKHKPKASFLPNEMFEYSNTGYALLGLIIEKVSNQSFGDFLKENIFTPLKMENTFIYRSRFKPEKVENYALGYVSDSLGNKVLLDSFGKDFYTYYLDGIVGDGMVNSTAKDLLKWDRALYTDKLVSAKDKELIFSSIKTEDGEDSNYGFGWSISESTKYGKIASHSGSWAGYITFIERDLDNDKTIIILQNNDTNLTSIPIKNTRKIVYNESIEVELINRVELTEEDLEKYLGVYSNSEFPLKLTISKMKNQLMAQATGQSAFPLESYENHTFKFDPAQIKMIFNLDKKIMEFTQGANKITFSKE